LAIGLGTCVVCRMSCVVRACACAVARGC
jgi:hypothetical protein